MLGLNFTYVLLNSVSVKNWDSLKCLSTTGQKRSPVPILSILMLFLELMPNEHLRYESSAKSSFLYNSSLGHLHMKDFTV